MLAKSENCCQVRFELVISIIYLVRKNSNEILIKIVYGLETKSNHSRPSHFKVVKFQFFSTNSISHIWFPLLESINNNSFVELKIQKDIFSLFYSDKLHIQTFQTYSINISEKLIRTLHFKKYNE